MQIIQIMFICVTVSGMLHWNGEDGGEWERHVSAQR